VALSSSDSDTIFCSRVESQDAMQHGDTASTVLGVLATLFALDTTLWGFKSCSLVSDATFGLCTSPYFIEKKGYIVK
jgi:hypothetical protein